MELTNIKIKNKRGQEWSIGRLLTIILVVVFLVLIIYGISSGGLKPLFDKISNSFDNILVMLGIRSAKSSTTEIQTTATIYDLPGQKLRIGDNWCVVNFEGKGGIAAGAYQVQFRDGGWKFDKWMSSPGGTGKYDNIDFRTMSDWNIKERNIYQAMVKKFGKPTDYKTTSSESSTYDPQTGAWMKYYYGDASANSYYYVPMWLDDGGLNIWKKDSANNGFFYTFLNHNWHCLYEFQENDGQKGDSELYTCDSSALSDNSITTYVYKGFKNALTNTYRNCFKVDKDDYCPENIGAKNVKFIAGLSAVENTGGMNPPIQVKVPGSNNWYSISWNPSSNSFEFYHQWSSDQSTWKDMDAVNYYYIYAPESQVPEMIELGKVRADLLKACQDS